ncbi:protein-L-isoaspartate O-methyltransferase [Euzebya sp.]|uniref:protein-L-isoaspartate O-methyltransferase family protein n=1 Tax=Euzebya sp. TaxID=1971409 RepID=UPI00351131D8
MTRTDPDALRDRMVADLRASGAVTSEAVATALRAVPRHRFVPELAPVVAYANRAQATLVRDGETLSSISQPAMVAMMLERAELRDGHRVLEIGTGTGYNAALMAHLVRPLGHVVTVDIEPALVERARATLAELGIADVTAITADGREGLAAEAPFDRVVVTAGAAEVAPAWVDQLVDGGRLVVPLSGPQSCVTYEKDGDRLRQLGAIGAAFLPVRAPS